MWLIMSEQAVLNGPAITLMEMLAARDQRVARQKELLTTYPQTSLISVTLRIPGPIKTGTQIHGVFKQLLADLLTQFKATLVFHEAQQLATGDLAFLVVTQPPRQLKQQLLRYEQQHRFCLLCDFDVVYLAAGQLQQVSRRELGVAPRRCLVCGGDAKVCSRTRKHGIKTVQQAVATIVQGGFS